MHGISQNKCTYPVFWSRWLLEQGYRAADELVHHWAFARNEGIGRLVPDFIKNQPWNYLRLAQDSPIHQLLHRQGNLYRRLGERSLGRVHQELAILWHGTPTWFKAHWLSIQGRLHDDYGKVSPDEDAAH
jgi:hypothetical protein